MITKNIIFTLCVLVVTASCIRSPTSEAKEEDKYAGPHKMECVAVSWSLNRCENREVVCYYYSYRGGGVSCKFKEIK